MVDMDLTGYAGLDDINVTTTGYACGTEGERIDTPCPTEILEAIASINAEGRPTR